MKTGGYDIVAEVNERFVDRALAAAFYTSSFPEVKGSYTPSGTPPSLSSYAKVDYEVRIREPPMVDAFAGNVVRLLFNVEAVLKVLSGLRLEFDAIASVETSPTYNQNTRTLDLNLKGARIGEIKINDKYGLSTEFLNHVNQAIAAAISSGVLDTVEKVQIQPVLYSLDLPYMPPGPANQLTIGLGNVKILNPQVIAAAVNLLGYTGGSINQVMDFTDGLDMAVGVSEAAMHRVFDFWWSRTTHPKSVTETGSWDIPVLDDLLDAVADLFDIATSLATLGFLETDYAVLRSWIDYGATVSFGKPSFSLLDGNRMELTNCPLHIHAWATPKLKVQAKVEVDTSGPVPDWMTPWSDDVTIASKVTTITIWTFTIDLDVDINRAEAEVYLDDQNRLMGKVKDVDVTVHLPWSLPEDVLNHIIDWVEDLIKDRIPPIPLSPALFTQTIPGTTLALEVDIDKLVTNTDEAIVGASVKFKEIPVKITPVPMFIANRDPLALEVHRVGCKRIEDMFEKNKVGYYSLLDALKDGYDGCKYCLPEYHTR
ncbi:MAG: hypothetical protein FGF53_01890 [Candidatus Brockarchaeota archaeon]|nr:hypothetical protein [Candidatus Brockarchaeota archaeon]MBO3808640.1 hypothetical protein [Candidatus Brockarchaeota archaeon]